MFARIRTWNRRRKADRLPIDAALWQAAESRLPFLAHLDDDERGRLRQLVREFLAEKQWTAARGLQLTPTIQLVIALQACLPILNLGLHWYAGWVGLVVYPGDFVIPRQYLDEHGVMHEFDDTVLGEAWPGGPVLLSWFEDEADDPASEGVNLVIHEFAHKLDMCSGEADGMPPLHTEMSLRAWRRTLGRAYDDFVLRDKLGEDTALDPYAAENPAEFFAVCSECFFERPNELLALYPEVYGQLKLFYRQDPASRRPAETP